MAILRIVPSDQSWSLRVADLADERRMRLLVRPGTKRILGTLAAIDFCAMPRAVIDLDFHMVDGRRRFQQTLSHP